MGEGVHMVHTPPWGMGLCRPGTGVVQEGHDQPVRTQEARGARARDGD